MEDLYSSIESLLPIINPKVEFPFYNEDAGVENFQHLSERLEEQHILGQICDLIRLKAEKILRHTIVPSFWSYSSALDSATFSKNVHILYQHYESYKSMFQRIQWMIGVHEKTPKGSAQDEVELFKITFKSALLSGIPVHFDTIVYKYLDLAFQALVATLNDDEDDGVSCRVCQDNQCKCRELLEQFNRTNTELVDMDIFDRICGTSITTLIHSKMDTHVNINCTGCFDKSHLADLEKWVQKTILPWLTKIFNKGSDDVSEPKVVRSIQNFQLKLSYTLYEIYARCIIEQFFNIIIDYPDSQPAVDDLCVCLEKLDYRSQLVNSLKKSLETRLLHPGVDTSDILTGYVAAIKTLKHLDKSGVLLQTVIEPVKEYLRNRNDTVRCVVASLIEDDGHMDLADELAKADTLKLEEGDKDDLSNWEQWKPDSIECEMTSNRGRPSDIISMVVDIYGSKELFVIEYRNLLAERLLNQLDFNPEKEIRNLELLKLRFGDTLLHSCEVMLKDISDSKRINNHMLGEIFYQAEKAFDMYALILSSQFWPLFKKETMNLPEPFQREFDRFTKQYEGYKGNRTLCWTPLNGKVNIDIELEDRTLELSVTPTQAVILYYFEQQNKWHLDSLSTVMNVPPSLLRKRIAFWQAQGLVRESTENVFELIEHSNNFEPCQSQAHDEDDETESAMASASDQREERLQVFWSYIVGMLTNLDSLPLERIHQMLKMFASQEPSFEFSQDELRSFLQRKVREHELLYTGGVYQLPKA